MMIIAGIDLGTAAIKVIFIDEKYSLLWSKAVPTSPESIKVSEELLQEGLKALSISKEKPFAIATTGYGKRIFPNANRIIDEITAIATGAYHLSNKKARTIVNLGGQDVKVIRIDSHGKVIDFRMNDKCAAGTGRFLDKVGTILNIPVDKFGSLSKQCHSNVTINSTCAVFIESEILSLLYDDIDKKDIITGIHRCIAKRVSDLIRGLSIEEEIYLDGGVAQDSGLLVAFEEELMMNIKRLSVPQFTAAIGAAIFLLKEKFTL